MKRQRILLRLGPRLFLSYVLASLAAAVSGLAAAFLAPAVTYQGLMLKVMYPLKGATLQQMDATLAQAIAEAVSVHVALSLAVAIVVSLAIAAYVSGQISSALRRLTAAARQLAKGDFGKRMPAEDIQEISDLGQDINSLAASLQESERRRNVAIASVGHELRTPVTALRAYCDGLREGILACTPEVLERMSRSIDRLERMAGDLSAFGRAEAHRYEDLTLTEVPASDALQASYDAMRMVFAGADVALLLDTEALEGISVRADAARLGEVLDNLLSNSLAHTPKGSRVSLGAKVHELDVELVVRDEGHGIGPEDLPHVTEPFYRGEGGSKGRTPRAGMGLGLAIASRLLDAMGGRLVLASPGLGLGTTASVFLPRVLHQA